MFRMILVRFSKVVMSQNSIMSNKQTNMRIYTRSLLLNVLVDRAHEYDMTTHGQCDPNNAEMSHA